MEYWRDCREDCQAVQSENGSSRIRDQFINSAVDRLFMEFAVSKIKFIIVESVLPLPSSSNLSPAKNNLLILSPSVSQRVQ